MRRFLLFALTILLTIPSWGLGDNSGNTQVNAIEFDWQNGNEQEAGTKWYRVDLSPLTDIDNPTLSLCLTNMDQSNTATLTVKAKILGQEETRDYTLEPGKSKTWVKGAAILTQTNTTEIFIVLTSDRKVSITARAYETDDVDEACLNATLFPIADEATFSQGGNSEIWYQVDLTDVMQGGSGADREVEVRIVNEGTGNATISEGLSLDCPSSGTTDRVTYIPAGEETTRTINRTMIDMLQNSSVYVRLNTNQPIQVITTYKNPENTTPIFESTSANTIEVEPEALYTLNVAGTEAEQIYKIRLDALRGKNLMPEVSVTNKGGAPATITAQIGMTPAPTSVIEKKATLNAGETRIRDIEKNLIDGISTADGYVYVRIVSSQTVSGSVRLKHIHEGDACKTSVDFSWENGHQQEANSTVWYAVDITEAKANIEDIIVSAENLSGGKATLTGELAFACPYLDLQSITRSLNANEVRTKRISYSLFGMLSVDTIYVGVTTDQKVRLSATREKADIQPSDDACLDAIIFDMKEGHKQEANEEIWYKVGVNSLRFSEKLPYISIQNRGTGALTIQGELSLDCPDEVSNATRSLSIPASGVYEKQIARDYIDKIDKAYDTVYVKLTGNQPFSFQVRMETENPGATCSSAILFNWTSGNDQNGATKAWYLVDLTAAKAGKKDIRLTLANRSDANATVSAGFAFACPCEVPQTETRRLSAKEIKTGTIPYAALETAGDSVWVVVNTDQNIHFEATLVDPEPFDEIPCPDEVTTFEWRKLYQEAGGQDTAWYYLDAAILQQITNYTDSTPRLYLHNTAETSNTIKANVAYHCPITSTMISRSVTMGNGQEIWKMLERSFAEQAANRDTILVQLIATGAYEFSAELVNPNDGADCQHALRVSLPDTLIQEAGTEAWYRLDVKEAASLRQKITFGIKNTDGTRGIVDAALYFACDSDAIAARTFTLGANQDITKEVTSDFFGGLKAEYAYMWIRTAQQVQVYADVSRLDTLIPNITACEDAIPVAPNILYTQEKDTAWYVVNVNDLRENTTGDGVLTVTNLSMNEVLTASAEVSWECPVVYEMTKKTRTIAADGKYVRTLQRSTIEATSGSVLYVRVAADGPVSFRFDITYDKGSECWNAIEFDWENGNIYASEEPLWYHVSIDSEKVPEGYDLRLGIDNLDMENMTDAGAILFFECDGPALTSIDHSFEPGESKHSTIDRQLLAAAGWPDLFICYHSNHTTKIYVDMVEHLERRDTIRLRICEGDWTNPITGETMLFYGPSSELAEVSDPLQWNDTVPVRGGSLNCDSIYTFYVTPLSLPTKEALTVETLTANNAVPILKQGMEVFTDSSLVNIERYLSLNDSIVLESAKWSNIPTGILGKDIEKITLTLTLKDSCENEIDYPFTLPVDPYRVDSINIDAAVCIGSEVEGRLGTHIIWNDTTWRDTVSDIVVADTLGLERQIDSVYIYTIKVHPILRESVSESICAGETFLFGGKELSEAGVYYDTVPSLVTGCDSITELTLKVLFPATEIVITTDTACLGDIYEWRGKALSETGIYKDTAYYTTGCDSVYYELQLTVQEPTAATIERATICAGETYEWRGMVLSETDIYKDTAYYTTGCDSVYYELQLTVQEPTTADIETATICAGETYEWREKTLSETGTYRDTAYYPTGCDSMYYELQLTVNPILYESISDTICEGDVYLFGDEAISIAGTYYRTIPSATTGCDSIVTLVLTVQTPATTAPTTATIPAGTSYTWHTWRDVTLSAAGTYFDTAHYTTGCDSVYYELQLTISDPVKEEITFVDTLCAGTEWTSRTQTLTINADTTWSEQIRFHDAVNGDIDSTYHYNLVVFRTTMPTIEESHISAVCGRAIDISEAEAVVNNTIAAEPLYAPNAQTKWLILKNEDWIQLDESSLDGLTTTITVKYVITSDCGKKESEPLNVKVEQPNPANSDELANLPAVNKYNSYLLMIHLNDIQATYGWTVNENDVTWYQIAGEADPLYPNDNEKDIEVGTGFYYTTGEQLEGSYYALITHPATDASDCTQSAMTVIITCADVASKAPALNPTVANPAQDIHVINLDPAQQTEIRIYDTTGNLLNTYKTTDAKEFIMRAAGQQGYYLVDVQTNGQTTTLRYIVK